MHSVYSIENPLMDYVMHEDYPFLDRFGARPGTMQLVEHRVFKEIIRSSRGYSVFPGGSGANTARGLSMLIASDPAIGQPCFSGGIGADDTGDRFMTILRDLGIETAMAFKDLPTGVSAIVVTPDHERTMFTYLGACRDFAPDDVSEAFIRSSKYLYSTGYMWDTEPQKQALFHAVDTARTAGVPVCFDLADPFVVDRYSTELAQWIRGRIDILFANRQELSRITECTGTDYEILGKAARLAEVVIMKIGKGGSIVQSGGRLSHAPGESVICVDTTGAGDAYSAGFIYGLLRGANPDACARLGNRIAARIVALEGCRYETINRADIINPILDS
jgi:sugar/nucleoside kinase (ribokinase family)